MASRQIELIDDNTLRLRDKRFEVYHREPALTEGITHDVEASASESSAMQSLSPWDLRGIKAEHLPRGLSITTYNLQALGPDFRRFTALSFSKLPNFCEMALDYGLAFADWEHPINLRHFADQFAGHLEATFPGRLRADVTASDVGVYINCRVFMHSTKDCASSFGALFDHITTEYRRQVQALRQHHNIPAGNSESISRFRWWLQWVVVPLAVAVLAVVATLLA